MSRQFDIIVVGVGAMGAAACQHLAARGVRVLGLERFPIVHDQGSSHGASRMIRMAYYEHADYVPLLRRAYELWDQLESESGQKLLYRTGGLYLGPRNCELVAGSLAAATTHGLPHELLPRQEIARRFPAFCVPDDWSGVYEPAAGFLRPERSIAAMATMALRSGAELHGNEPVLEWSAGDRGVQVITARESYQADHLLFCGGAWSQKLVGDLGVALRVTRQVMGWVWPRQRAELFALGAFPVWAIDRREGGIYYGFPMISEVPGLKLAHHGPETPADPDQVARETTPADEQTFRPALQQYLPSADGPLLAMRICLYTNSPDGHFVIDRHPRHKNVTLACGFSGHGFKFASVIGQILADLATTGATPLPAQFLGLSRFGQARDPL